MRRGRRDRECKRSKKEEGGKTVRVAARAASLLAITKVSLTNIMRSV